MISQLSDSPRCMIMTIGEKIKAKREELGLTQDDLAKKVGYKSRSSINKIELSHELPLKKIARIAKALGISPVYLMGWSDDDHTPLEKYEEEGRAFANKELYEAFKKCLEMSSDNQNIIIGIIDQFYEKSVKG